MQHQEKPADIIVLAGQSNAEGNGFGEINPDYMPSEEILMLRDAFPCTYGADGTPTLISTRPTVTVIEIAKERIIDDKPVGNLALFFAQRYAKESLPEGRHVLIVQTAVGGTGFAGHLWGVGEILDERMKDMVVAALSQNPGNRIVAFLWHQGEHDAFENPDLTPEQRCAFYENHFFDMLLDFRTHFSAYDVPVITAGFCDTWAVNYAEQCDAIYRAYRNICSRDNHICFLPTHDLHSNDQDVRNGDTIHFSKHSLMLLGNRYFNAYLALRSKQHKI